MAAYTKAQRARDWLTLWGMPEGQRAIADLFNANGVFRSIFHGSDAGQPLDPVRGFIMEGRRQAALDIVQAIGVSESEFERITTAMKENQSDETEYY